MMASPNPIPGGRASRALSRASGIRAVRMLCLWLAAIAAPEAQVRTVEILNADQVVVENDSLNGLVRRMTGNVRVRSDTTTLSARSVVEYAARREVILTGGVRIIAGDDTLTADRVTYNSGTKQSVAEGRVRIGAEGGILFAPEATYNSNDKRATFTGGGRLLQDGAELTAPSGTYDTQRRFADVTGPLALRDSASTLTAARGTYDARSRRADVVGDVVLLRERDRLDADSLVYFRRTERGRAFGRVVLDRQGGDAPEDSLRRGLLFGSALIYDGQAETAEMTAGDGLALLVTLDRDSTGTVDTTLVQARRLVAARERADDVRVEALTASGGACLWRDGLGAAADSARFVRRSPADSANTTRDRLDLFGGTGTVDRPTVWLDGSQLVGDSLWIVSGGLRDSVFARGRAFAGQLDSTLGRVQQLAGARMLGIVRDDALRRLHVWPQAEAVYYQATADGLLDGAVRIGADSLVFRFDASGEIREAGVFGNVDGTRYGPSIVPASLSLPGFTFTPEARPAREDLLAGWEAEWLRRRPEWATTEADVSDAAAPEAEMPEGDAEGDTLAPLAPEAE